MTETSKLNRRSATIAALGAMVVLASHAGAAPKPKPQITDAKGDYPVASADIISATLSTVPNGAHELLRIDLKLAAAPTNLVPYSYTVRFTVPGCNFVAAYFGGSLPGVQQASAVGCATGNNALPQEHYGIQGSTITFTVPMTGALMRGAKATSLFAGTEPGALSSSSVLGLLGDTATGTDWVLGSDRPKKK